MQYTLVLPKTTTSKMITKFNQLDTEFIWSCISYIQCIHIYCVNVTLCTLCTTYLIYLCGTYHPIGAEIHF